MIVYPKDGYVLKNIINGVFSFMANTKDPDAWENVEMDEYERWRREHPNIDDAFADESLTRYANELTGAHDETLTEATETLIKFVKEEQ